MKSYRPSPSNSHFERNFHIAKSNARIKLHARVYHVANRDNTGKNDSQYISNRVLKRSSPYSSTVLEAYTGNTQKLKAADQEGKRRRVDPATFHEKVDDIAYAGESLVEKHAYHSFYNRLSGYSDLDRAKLATVVNECDYVGSSEQNDSDNDASSVGSCSANTMQTDGFYNCSFAVPCQARELNCSDAESFYCSLDEEEKRIHCLGGNVEGYIWKHASLV